VEAVRHIEGVIAVRDQTDLPRYTAMIHRHDRTLVTSGLARVEGEGAMHVRVRGSHVDEVRLNIYEPPRFFEAFPRGGPGRYLSLLERAAAGVDIPVIASLNGATTGGWTDYASALQDAGAAAIELNIYYLPGDPPPLSPSPLISGSDVERRHVEILTTVKAVVTVPVAVKLSPYFSSTGEMAHRLDRAGADGLVLFNRFLQPDIDPETLTVTVRPGLSAQAEGRLPRTWIALLAGRVRASLAATTGVETAADVASSLLAGADVVMTASALLRHGPGYAGVMLGDLSDWMARKGFGSVAAVRGLLAVPDGTDQAAYERAGYVTALEEANKGYGPW
jgi:dihydroorotate dehydrogenase (fumarate)